MATVDLTFFVTNRYNIKDQVSATNVKVAIPTPPNLVFDTVITGSTYSDALKQWTIDSIAVNETKNITLRYNINTGTSWNVNAYVLSADQQNINGDKIQSSVTNPEGWFVVVAITNATVAGVVDIGAGYRLTVNVYVNQTITATLKAQSKTNSASINSPSGTIFVNGVLSSGTYTLTSNLGDLRGGSYSA
jgi:hypothetical protein